MKTLTKKIIAMAGLALLLLATSSFINGVSDKTKKASSKTCLLLSGVIKGKKINCKNENKR